MRTLRSWRKLCLLFLAPAALLVAACDELTEPGLDELFDFGVDVTLQNLDTPVVGQAVHIFGPGETFPSGRLEPGASRVISGMTFSVGESAVFQAGRNGSILATRSCTCSEAGCASDSKAKVEWNGSALSCVGW